jgi:hypothetical protein
MLFVFVIYFRHYVFLTVCICFVHVKFDKKKREESPIDCETRDTQIINYYCKNTVSHLTGEN